ncbi:MAG TPA: DegT/DnrJ/EryC1/StrS family aminotransferase [Sphingomicrobium sp.]
MFRATLPPSDSLQPYLRRLDDSRHYSNFGELGAELTHRLANAVGCMDRQLVLTSSGTAALVAAILACAGRATSERPYCLLPAYTFAATAFAAEMCGYELRFVDVGEGQWWIDPRALVEHPLLNRAGLVVPVCPYGAPIPMASWQDFHDSTGVSVVIDGAAAFEQLLSGSLQISRNVPVALSFHATKPFATGEGGAVVCRDSRRIAAAYQSINFGMLGERKSRTAGFNGKMSEYHAAVGLAELDGWASKATEFKKVADQYRQAFEARGLAGKLVTAPLIASSYILFVANDASEGASITQGLREAGIEYRYWYGQGLHFEPYFAEAARDELGITNALAPTIIGLPAASDLRPEAISRVANAIDAALGCA